MNAAPRGNHIAEWYGHRAFPIVAATTAALADQQAGRCPFLTDVTGQDRKCTKNENSQGVCTVSSVSGEYGRQDWLVCPIRTLDVSLVENVARRLFDHPSEVDIQVVAVPTLNEKATHEAFVESVLAASHRSSTSRRSSAGRSRSLAPPAPLSSRSIPPWWRSCRTGRAG